jgi:hypothetical protein
MAITGIDTEASNNFPAILWFHAASIKLRNEIPMKLKSCH